MERNLLAELYINRDNDKVVNFNKPYDKLVSHKRSDIKPFNHIGGLRPYVQSEQTRTTAMDFNAEMDERNVDKETQGNFYLNTIKQNKDEINYLKRQNKLDHIKKIDLALNFKQKPTNYTEAFDYTAEKKFETENPDTLHHYKKSFMKTYEESKLQHLHIIRK